MKVTDKLRANWSKRENDVMLHYPLGFGTRSDGHWLSGVFNKEFTEELASRGYDITTMKFSVGPKAGEHKFHSTRKPNDKRQSK
mgnify:CR=1 FL=1